MIRLRTPMLGWAAAALMIATGSARADGHAEVDRLFGAGQLAEALQKADQSLAANPRDARVRFLKGLVLSEMGRTPEAIEVFVKLSADHPELPEPHNNLAVLYGKQGQYEQARRSLEAAIRTNPSYATAYENLGDVYAKLASQAYSKALLIDGSNQKVTPKLAMIRDLFAPQAGGSRVVAAPAPRPIAQAPAPVVRPAAPAPAPAPVVRAPAPPQPSATGKPAPAAPSAKAAAPSAALDTTGPKDAALAWAAAWSRQDMNTYLAAYTRDFPAGKNRKAWENERRARITGKRSISVNLSDFSVDVQADRAVVEFRQDYKADSLKVSSRKRLDMVRVAGQWLIQKESTGS